ncbi:cytochrome c biogenesis protein CcsA [Cohnella thailandensis]|uniref:Cytochrome c biogenesis protein CcsA n=1 Tax=Cohnella thailandensis TaxID=557557 RepID=A0A841SRQ5_9BACL|nr:cytochrome c biogenesis protein CcsA [Cohnella thailandensis]MBB6633892.1 cytochrome c biogenesis protein CcsA [Cohnella thailandensis]MBP1972575.1 HemX protein [Cohnella thailandensis]
MLTNDWLTDAVLYIYALSLLFFVSDVAYGNRSGRRIGTGLLVFAWILQTFFLLDLLIRHLDNPDVTFREYVFFVSWILLSVSFVIDLFFKAQILVLLVNVVAFAVFLVNLLGRTQRSGASLASGEVAHRLMIIHVALITLAFVVLTISALLAGMHLFLNERLKKKRFGTILTKMPSLETLDKFIFHSSIVGVPLLLLSLSTGTAAFLLEERYSRIFDLRVLLSFAAVAMYILYLVRKGTNPNIGTKGARWNLYGYLLLIVGFFASSLSDFHNWL